MYVPKVRIQIIFLGLIVKMILLSLFLFFVSFSSQAETHHVPGKSNELVSEMSPGEYKFYSVKYVYDGDTILLTNEKRIRLSGINTPEVKRRYKKSQVGGKEARAWLLKRLKNTKVRLQGDVEKKDKYGRTLAHVFTEDNEHINLQLVEKGFASVNIHLPNLMYADALFIAQQQAEEKQLGIWQYKEYKPKRVSELKKSNVKGWQRVIGQLKKIHRTDKNIYLIFADNFAVKIKRKSSSLFPDLDSYVGSQMEVRGWIYKHRKRYILPIYHPTQLIRK